MTVIVIKIMFKMIYGLLGLFAVIIIIIIIKTLFKEEAQLALPTVFHWLILGWSHLQVLSLVFFLEFYLLHFVMQ